MSGRWALSLSLSLSLCVLFLAGCVDTHTSPELPASDEGPTSSDPFFAIESAPVTLSTTRAPVLTYFCSTSRRTSGLDASGNARYEYGLLRFRYSEREYAVEAGGEEVEFIVHVNDDVGEIEWAAWCHIPRSPASVEHVLDRLGLAAHVSTEQVLSRPSPKRRGEPMGTEVQPMWGGGDDDEDDDRCGAGEVWDPELGGCVTPIELPPIIVDPPPGGSPPPEPDPEPDPDPWPWPDPDPEDPGGGGGGDHGGGTPPEPPDPTEDCEAGQECEDEGDFSWDEVCNRFLEPGCEWRHPSTWSQAEHAGIQAAIDVIRGNGCSVEANLLESAVNSGFLQLFDARIVRGGVLYGRFDRPTGIILMWTGYNAMPGDSVNWKRTLTHEALHKHLGVSNHPPGFHERVAECIA